MDQHLKEVLLERIGHHVVEEQAAVKAGEPDDVAGHRILRDELLLVLKLSRERKQSNG